MHLEQLDLRLRGYSEPTETATISVRSYARPERVRRAVTGLAAAWGAALLSVFIPVAHFLLVPGFVLFGLFLFVTRIRTDRVVVDATGTCPDCGTQQTLDVHGRWHLPRQLACSHCHRILTLAADDSAA